MLSYRLIRERGGGAEMKKSTVLEAEQEKGETGVRRGGEEEEIPLAWSSSVSSVRAVQAAAGDLIGTNEGGFR